MARRPRLPKPPATEPEGRLVGYARVSTDDQDLSLQIDALSRAGVDPDNLHTDKASGVSTRRPGLKLCLKDLRPGDTLVVWKCDRLGRDPVSILGTIRQLGEQGIGFRSLTEGVDTTTSAGRLLLVMLSGMAQFERDLISERTRAGMRIAKQRGAQIGKQFMFPDREAARSQMKALRDAGRSVSEIARDMGVSRGTVRNYLRRHWRRK